MAKNGLRAFDSDMHVFEPADLSLIREAQRELGIK